MSIEPFDYIGTCLEYSLSRLPSRDMRDINHAIKLQFQECGEFGFRPFFLYAAIRTVGATHLNR